MRRIATVLTLATVFFLAFGMSDGGDRAYAGDSCPVKTLPGHPCAVQMQPTDFCVRGDNGGSGVGPFACYCLVWDPTHTMCLRWQDGNPPPPPGPMSNYGGFESGNPIYCNSSHNGWVFNPMEATYRCQFDYHPGAGVYDPRWGYEGSCPTGAPLYGYCWHWHQL